MTPLPLQRPALTHKLPASHEIELQEWFTDDDVRNGNSGLIVHLLGYIFGTRLQFYDWWHDGRIPIKSTHNINVSPSTVEDFLSKSYHTWKAWGDEHKKWFLNILIMHSRAPSYEWDWERFTIEYMVFDGAYKLASELHNIGRDRISHKKRFEVLLTQFGLVFDEDKISEIYNLRNDLFHQSLWDKGQPCTSRSGNDAIYHQLNLSKINSRLIPALLGYKTKYINSPWWSLGCQRFYGEE